MNISKYIGLVYQIILKEIRVRYKQTLLGVAWVIIQPLGYMMVFSVVFHSMINRTELQIPYSTYALSGLIVWTFFTSSLQRTQMSLVTNISLLSKIRLPHESIILGTLLSFIVDIVVSSFLFIVIAVYYKVDIMHTSLLFVFIPMIILLAFIYGLTLFISVITIYFRDVQYLVSFILRIMLFTTTVIYPSNFVPESLRFLVEYNPLTIVIESIRDAVFFGKAAMTYQLFLLLILSIVLVITGTIFIKHNEKNIVDVL